MIYMTVCSLYKRNEYSVLHSTQNAFVREQTINANLIGLMKSQEPDFTCFVMHLTTALYR